MVSEPLGLVAGGGALPARIRDLCLDTGRPLCVLALEDHADPALVTALPDTVPWRWLPLGAVGQGLAFLHDHGVREVVLAGHVRRPRLRALMPDRRGAALLARLGMRALGDDTLLRAVMAELEREGLTVVPVEALLETALAPAGLYGRHRPDATALADLAHGVTVARALGQVDVGQAVVVQGGRVLGVEAVEGTDALLARAGALRETGPGPVLVKVCKPGQDRRSDLPTIGETTLINAAAAGCAGVAVEAGAALVVDRAAVVARADADGLFVGGFTVDGAGKAILA